MNVYDVAQEDILLALDLLGSASVQFIRAMHPAFDEKIHVARHKLQTASDDVRIFERMDEEKSDG